MKPTPEEKCVKCWRKKQFCDCKTFEPLKPSLSPEARCEHDFDPPLRIKSPTTKCVKCGYVLTIVTGSSPEARVDWDIQIRDAIFQFRGDKLTHYVRDVICQRMQIIIQAAFEKGREAR